MSYGCVPWADGIKEGMKQSANRSAVASLVRDVGMNHLFKSSEMEKVKRGNYLKHQEAWVSPLLLHPGKFNNVLMKREHAYTKYSH